jgi:putative ribosome biogenesis GTPase RsgA
MDITPNPNQILIAVLGVTGAGKSTFINRARGDDEMKVGHGMLSCKNP